MFFRKKKRTLKLGLALGSGGAKGFAELGALFAFEQAGLEFDAVAGTSIGSIIGAFYCAGYSATDIAELLKRVDVSEIKNRFMIQMDTMGLFSVIDNSIGNLDIEELKKPFAAVATEQKTGKETVFFKGSVAKALCASSSYPPFFKPVIVDGTEYVDGAFVNSVPADVVKALGADVVVGFDLSNRNPQKDSMITNLFNVYDAGVAEPWKKGEENSDVFIHPDLTAYKPVSFGAANDMFEIGYAAAEGKIDEIRRAIYKAKKKLGIKPDKNEKLFYGRS